MKYRNLGKTGMQVGIIGLGAEHLDGKDYDIVKDTICAAMEHDINMLDVFMPGNDIRQKIGRAIKGNRNKFIIQGHIGSTDINQQYDISRDLEINKKYFENLMIDLNTDYIDFGMLFFIDSEEHFDEVFNSGIVRYAEELKRNGTIRAIGASSHNPVIAKKVVETGIVELLMFSINPAFDMIPSDMNVLNCLESGFDANVMFEIDKPRQELYRTCESLDIPITVMKTLAGGKLLSDKHTPFSKPLTVSRCIHYALTRPSVASVLIGCQNRKQIEEAVTYLTEDVADLDYTEAISGMNKNFKGNCVYCNHCLPCPAGIDIASVTKYLDIATMNNNAIQKGVGQHYKELPTHGSDCIKCGSCESKCPFSVSIIENMEKAVRVFGE
ncbi:MAG: aldo/keto reductase [Eubacterium sp.]|jgi:predicted aldo/keto reductase-like oxidoreductase|nr:aldo/keto reductase [Eubacterium sp.]